MGKIKDLATAPPGKRLDTRRLGRRIHVSRREVTISQMRPSAFIAMCALSCTVAAECVRYVPPPKGTPPDLDGPGSWGELQDTVTLDCLRYVGSIERNGKEHVLIKDERGKVYELQIGNFMGENTGRIVKIDVDAIYVEQIVNRNDEWRPVIVKFAK